MPRAKNAEAVQNRYWEATRNGEVDSRAATALNRLSNLFVKLYRSGATNRYVSTVVDEMADLDTYTAAMEDYLGTEEEQNVVDTVNSSLSKLHSNLMEALNSESPEAGKSCYQWLIDEAKKDGQDFVADMKTLDSITGLGWELEQPQVEEQKAEEKPVEEQKVEEPKVEEQKVEEQPQPVEQQPVEEKAEEILTPIVEASEKDEVNDDALEHLEDVFFDASKTWERSKTNAAAVYDALVQLRTSALGLAVGPGREKFRNDANEAVEMLRSNLMNALQEESPEPGKSNYQWMIEQGQQRGFDFAADLKHLDSVTGLGLNLEQPQVEQQVEQQSEWPRERLQQVDLTPHMAWQMMYGDEQQAEQQQVEEQPFDSAKYMANTQAYWAKSLEDLLTGKDSFPHPGKILQSLGHINALNEMQKAGFVAGNQRDIDDEALIRAYPLQHTHENISFCMSKSPEEIAQMLGKTENGVYHLLPPEQLMQAFADGVEQLQREREQEAADDEMDVIEDLHNLYSDLSEAVADAGLKDLGPALGEAESALGDYLENQTLEEKQKRLETADSIFTELMKNEAFKKIAEDKELIQKQSELMNSAMENIGLERQQPEEEVEQQPEEEVEQQPEEEVEQQPEEEVEQQPEEKAEQQPEDEKIRGKMERLSLELFEAINGMSLELGVDHGREFSDQADGVCETFQMAKDKETFKNGVEALHDLLDTKLPDDTTVEAYGKEKKYLSADFYEMLKEADELAGLERQAQQKQQPEEEAEQQPEEEAEQQPEEEAEQQPEKKDLLSDNEIAKLGTEDVANQLYAEIMKLDDPRLTKAFGKQWGNKVLDQAHLFIDDKKAESFKDAVKKTDEFLNTKLPKSNQTIGEFAREKRLLGANYDKLMYRAKDIAGIEQPKRQSAAKWIEDFKKQFHDNPEQFKSEPGYPMVQIARIMAARELSNSTRGKAATLNEQMTEAQIKARAEKLMEDNSFQKFAAELKQDKNKMSKVEAIFTKRFSHGGELDDSFRSYLANLPAGELQNNPDLKRWMPTVKQRVEKLQKDAAKAIKEKKVPYAEAAEIVTLRQMAEVQRGGRGLEANIPVVGDRGGNVKNLSKASKAFAESKDFKEAFNKEDVKKYILSGHGGAMVENYKKQPEADKVKEQVGQQLGK